MSTSLAYKESWADPIRRELINGKLVMMSPVATNHALISNNISYLFTDYLKGKPCTPIPDGVTVFLTDEDHFVPDFMVVCDRDKLKGDGVHGAPDLVVEVLSLSTMKNDRTHKKDIYGQCGVREYWLVNPADKTVEVYRNSGTELILQEVYAIYPDWMLARMTEEERAAVATHFKCSLFDDLDIALDDIFSNLLPA